MSQMRDERFEKMLSAGAELLRAARGAYPKASDKTLKIVCESAVELALEEQGKPVKP